ncbi:related to high affinity nicotinic acid permease [Cephalotrichum gorgonifer]|uniref:Related to high affinity nicotinic acid permease n=1 Tax=Cephalotrichum gorgonifer TaxID=2041049 RepID=A0AAE8MUP5_9PEZI|nr:related to high affinity nicotinic acid permease [Cephalotrichum gorgonifer]
MSDEVKEKPLEDESHSVDVSPTGQQIDPAIQKRALLKFDAVVLGCFGLMYMLANLDRNNLGNANIMGLPEDLNLKGNQFGNAVSIFFATYVVFEAPCSIILKPIGPRYLLSVCMLGWGAVCLSMAFVKNANQLYACRLLLGLFEASLIPCINTYAGMVYLRSEMSIRSAIYYAFSAIAGAFGGLLASGISTIKNNTLNHWSWLFLIEGAMTIGLVPVIFFAFPESPLTAWFLNEEERNVMRLRYELNPHLGIDEAFSWNNVFSAFKDVKLWIHAVLQFSVDISLFGFTTFLPALVKGLGYTGVHAQLLTVPVYAWATIAYFGIAFASDGKGLRGPFILGALVFLVAGYAVMLGTDSIAARYTAVFILAVGIYPTTGIAIVWLNSNFAGHYKRATAVGTTFTIGNVAGAVVGQIFQAQSQPRYLPGVRIALAFGCLAMVLVLVLMAGLHWTNKKRQQRLAQADDDVTHEAWRLGQMDDYSDLFKYNL